MLAHATDGSERIKKGIYLRWASHYKLRFPSAYKLFRRTNHQKTTCNWELINDQCGYGLSYDIQDEKLKSSLIKYADDPCNPEWEMMTAMSVLDTNYNVELGLHIGINIGLVIARIVGVQRDLVMALYAYHFKSNNL